MRDLSRILLLTAGVLSGFLISGSRSEAQTPSDLDWLVPNESLKKPFAEQTPIIFVSRGQNRKEWDSLPKYWNEAKAEVVNPATGQKVTRTVIKIKLPLGLNLAPPVPAENPMTYARWELGKKLYFDAILCSDLTVSCATCHSPKNGYTDGLKVSTGIGGQKGGMSAPPVLNSAYNRQQFWDGRAASLEEQAQGPPQNPIEMFDGKGNAWNEVVKRVRAKPEYVKLFEKEFGHVPTRDSVAKAIATYERTVLVGNSLFDRAEATMRKRVEDEEGNKFEIQPKDFEAVLKAAVTAKDEHALKALSPAPEKLDIPETAKSLDRGRILYFGKARCATCHVGENLTDYAYHNLGVGVKDGKLPAGDLGRFGSLPTGHKDPTLFGAFKTPPLRGLLSTKPYMHDGSEDTLEKVVDFYDKGGNANEFLDPKMRDFEAEQKIIKSGAKPKEVTVWTRDGKPVVPLKLNLTVDEKKDLVLFLRALESDPVDATVADPKWFK
ncbi:MAG: cytochrome C peroxidase [Planctomycetes bacterium]|nr:cytochrome C peroxidase [Planctomycetota bacterium]